MSDMSLFKALPVAIAASASAIFSLPAIAQSSRPIEVPVLNSSSATLFDPAFNSSELPTVLPAQDASTIFSEQTSQLSSPNSFPNIDIRNDGPPVRVILIDPIEQSYLNTWEQTATTQISDVNIRSAVQAPITQIRIRAGRPVVERLGRDTTDSFFFNSTPTNTLSNFPRQRRRTALSDLPDGNYRVLLSSRGIGDGGIVEEGRLFTFRKAGDRVIGDFDYVGSGESACVTGTLQGNTVFGEAFPRSGGVQVLGKTYLGSGLSLQLSNSFNDNSAVLSLNGFSFVNAGTVAPPTACR